MREAAKAIQQLKALQTQINEVTNERRAEKRSESQVEEERTGGRARGYTEYRLTYLLDQTKQHPIHNYCGRSEIVNGIRSFPSSGPFLALPPYISFSPRLPFSFSCFLLFFFHRHAWTNSSIFSILLIQLSKGSSVELKRTKSIR